LKDKYDIPPHVDQESFKKWLQTYRSRNQNIQLLQTYISIN
jgi:hypothetical protein